MFQPHCPKILLKRLLQTLKVCLFLTKSPETLQTASDEHMASQDHADLDGSDTIDEFFY